MSYRRVDFNILIAAAFAEVLLLKPLINEDQANRVDLSTIDGDDPFDCIYAQLFGESCRHEIIFTTLTKTNQSGLWVADIDGGTIEIDETGQDVGRSEFRIAWDKQTNRFSPLEWFVFNATYRTNGYGRESIFMDKLTHIVAYLKGEVTELGEPFTV